MSAWQKQIPSYMAARLRNILDELEAFRVSVRCPDDHFVLHVVGSHWAIRHALRDAYNMTLLSMTDATARERVVAVYEQRRVIQSTTGVEYPPLPRECQTFNDLAEFIVGFESQFDSPDSGGAKQALERLLASVDRPVA